MLNKLFTKVAKFVLITAVTFCSVDFVSGQEVLSTIPIIDSKYSSDKQVEGTSLTSTKLAAEDVTPNVNIGEHIYLVTTSDVASISTNGKELPVKPYSFIDFNESTKTSWLYGKIKNPDQLSKVPEEITNDNFYLSFKLKNGNNWADAVKVLPTSMTLHKNIDDYSEKLITKKILVYGAHATRDLTLYRGKYIKYPMSGKIYYLPVDELDIELRSIRDLKLTSRYIDGRRVATDKPLDISLAITSPSNASADEINRTLHGTNLAGLGQAFVDMESRYGVNALFGVAVAITESGWGDSYLARNRNNLFGIAAYDGNEGAAYSFSSKEAAINYWGNMIKDVYFDRGYTDLYSVNSIYAANTNWANQVGGLMNSIKNEINNSR